MAADDTGSALGVTEPAPAEAAPAVAGVPRSAGAAPVLGANPIGDTVDLVKRYFLQETVEPLSRIGRTLAYGLGGALLLAIGLTLSLVAFLRLLQEETGTVFAGNWSWVPYTLTAILGVALIGILGFVASRGLRRDTRGDGGDGGRVRALGGLAFAGRLVLGGALMAAGVASAAGAAAEPERPETSEKPERNAPPSPSSASSPATTPAEKVTIGDIENRFRALEGAATEVISERTSGPNFVLLAVGGSVLLLALVYVLGRRRGRRRGSVLGIRRLV